MKLGLFITINEHEGGNYRTGKNYAYAQIGEIVYQTGSVVPVIHENRGCLGLAQVLETSTTGRTTSVKFQMLGQVDKESLRAYYNLYKANSAAYIDDDDLYGSGDVVIGGAIGLLNRPQKNSSGSSKPKTSGITAAGKRGYNPFD